MKKAKLIAGLLVIFVTLPIWFYLMHFMLTKTGASELQWFLFWVYMPAGVLVHALTAIASASE